MYNRLLEEAQPMPIILATILAAAFLSAHPPSPEAMSASQASDPDGRVLGFLARFGYLSADQSAAVRPGEASAFVDRVLAERRLAWIEGSIDGKGNGSLIALSRPAPPAGPVAEATHRLGAMATCARRAAATAPAVLTSVDLRLLVAPDGIVQEERLARFEPRRPAAEACILRLAAGWLFPPSFRQQHVTIRFALPR
jgi:hypothetical protein